MQEEESIYVGISVDIYMFLVLLCLMYGVVSHCSHHLQTSLTPYEVKSSFLRRHVIMGEGDPLDPASAQDVDQE